MKFRSNRLVRKIARLLKRPLSFCCVYIDRMVEPAQMLALISKLRPHKTRFNLIRLGREYDGGYLLPNDLHGIAACFSPGVADSATFEMDILAKANIPSHLADYSVNKPPMDFKPKSFTRKYIGTVNDDVYMTLDHWVQSQEASAPGQDLLLQMDIEGWEYPTLLNVSEDTLKKFRIIILEIHDIESWGNPNFYRIADACFSRLLQHFHVVHLHPNNFCGQLSMGGLTVPRVFELTLLRKDRSESLGYCDTFPHPLDAPNVPHYPDIKLPAYWYGASAA